MTVYTDGWNGHHGEPCTRWGAQAKKGENGTMLVSFKTKPATPAALATAASGTLLTIAATSAAKHFKTAKLLTEKRAAPDDILFEKQMGAMNLEFFVVPMLVLFALSATSLVKRIREYVKGPV
jgi:hypothetical protein